MALIVSPGPHQMVWQQEAWEDTDLAPKNHSKQWPRWRKKGWEQECSFDVLLLCVSNKLAIEIWPLSRQSALLIIVTYLSAPQRWKETRRKHVSFGQLSQISTEWLHSIWPQCHATWNSCSIHFHSPRLSASASLWLNVCPFWKSCVVTL